MTAVYCPATLNIMRKHAPQGIKAVSEILGWPVERTASIARRHAIEIGGGAPAATPPAPSLMPRACTAPPPRKEFEGYGWDRGAGVITSPYGSVQLRPVKVRLFDIMWRSPERILGPDLAHRLGLPTSNPTTQIRYLNEELRPVRLKVQGAKGSTSAGYLLVKMDPAP